MDLINYQKKLQDIFQYLAEALSDLAHSHQSVMSAVISLDYARALRNAKILIVSFQDVVSQGQTFYLDLQEKGGAGLSEVGKKEAWEKIKQIFFQNLNGYFKILSVKAEVNLEELDRYRSSAKPDPLLLKQLQELKDLTVDDFFELIILNK